MSAARLVSIWYSFRDWIVSPTLGAGPAGFVVMQQRPAPFLIQMAANSLHGKERRRGVFPTGKPP